MSGVQRINLVNEIATVRTTAVSSGRAQTQLASALITKISHLSRNFMEVTWRYKSLGTESVSPPAPGLKCSEMDGDVLD